MASLMNSVQLAELIDQLCTERAEQSSRFILEICVYLALAAHQVCEYTAVATDVACLLLYELENSWCT